ncbi:MAG: bifunctional adenosylcobinamide kinase/adenosylcobinamide-phosphate guanylyltransferase [Lachnospiraceae bacterium]|nr:bifunctional adenosylcobinamide kinase/adenosylcobinamide-phosphate guanylyltransferase [Lachnospiraceae bacterium]
MKLIIGGCCQGKLQYVYRTSGLLQDAVLYGVENKYKTDEIQIPVEGTWIWNDFQDWFQKMLEERKDPETTADQLLIDHSNIIIICDEIGNGIVPLSIEERLYRERLGKYLCSLAERAESVERILCGLSQKLK